MNKWIKISYPIAVVGLIVFSLTKNISWLSFSFAMGWFLSLLVEQAGDRLEKILLVARESQSPKPWPKPAEWVEFRTIDDWILITPKSQIAGLTLSLDGGEVELTVRNRCYRISEHYGEVFDKLGIRQSDRFIWKTRHNYSTEPGKAGVKQWP